MVNFGRSESPRLSSNPFEEWCEFNNVQLNVNSGTHKQIEEYSRIWNDLMQATLVGNLDDDDKRIASLNIAFSQMEERL